MMTVRVVGERLPGVTELGSSLDLVSWPFLALLLSGSLCCGCCLSRPLSTAGRPSLLAALHLSVCLPSFSGLLQTAAASQSNRFQMSLHLLPDSVVRLHHDPRSQCQPLDCPWPALAGAPLPRVPPHTHSPPILWLPLVRGHPSWDPLRPPRPTRGSCYLVCGPQVISVCRGLS